MGAEADKEATAHARYVALLDQRERVLAKIAGQLYSRRRIRGNNLALGALLVLAPDHRMFTEQ